MLSCSTTCKWWAWKTIKYCDIFLFFSSDKIVYHHQVILVLPFFFFVKYIWFRYSVLPWRSVIAVEHGCQGYCSSSCHFFWSRSSLPAEWQCKTPPWCHILVQILLKMVVSLPEQTNMVLLCQRTLLTTLASRRNTTTVSDRVSSGWRITYHWNLYKCLVPLVYISRLQTKAVMIWSTWRHLVLSQP